MSQVLDNLDRILALLQTNGITQKQRNEVAEQLRQMIELNHESAKLQLDSAEMFMKVAKVAGLVVDGVWLHQANNKRTKQLAAVPALKLVTA